MTGDKTLNLKNLQEYPISTAITTLLTIFAVGWVVYRPFLVEDLSADFVTKAELTKQMDSMTNKLVTMQNDVTETQKTITITQEAINRLDTQVNITAAFQMERGYQDDLDKHQADKPSPVTARWIKTQRELTDKRDLAEQYRNCVRKEEKNCEQLQKQLWQ